MRLLAAVAIILVTTRVAAAESRARPAHKKPAVALVAVEGDVGGIAVTGSF